MTIKAHKELEISYLRVWHGEGVLWIENVYHLYPLQSDSERDAYFLRSDVSTFIKSAFKKRLNGVTYFVQFMFDVSEEKKNIFLDKYLSGHAVYKVNFNE